MTPKFRAWTEEGEVMYYDVYPFKDDTLLLSYDEIAFDEVPASDFILMQSTGLKDKYGKEIFDGDIVKFSDCDDDVYVTPVVWDKNYACFGVSFSGGYPISFDYLEEFYTELKDIEVVGNIYENKELLEGK
ncbi:hypothetical protein Si088_00740 [Streptococcus infantarius subsp. infantarius]|nr:hypothetical protein [Streptococcus infantarius subsp. infantarius]